MLASDFGNRAVINPPGWEPTPRNCPRCGLEFLAFGGARVCPACHLPKVRSHTRSLSRREKQIAERIIQAKPNKVIAWELHLTEGTIKEYLNRTFRKLGIKNRTELAVWAIRTGALNGGGELKGNVT